MSVIHTAGSSIWSRQRASSSAAPQQTMSRLLFLSRAMQTAPCSRCVSLSVHLLLGVFGEDETGLAGLAGCQPLVLLPLFFSVCLCTCMRVRVRVCVVCSQVSTGSCKYSPETNSIIWTIKQFPGHREFFLRAHFNLPRFAGARKPLFFPFFSFFFFFVCLFAPAV